MIQRTYWHLEPLKRKPTDYEITTSRLLYHPQRGFEVQVPLASWYERHQRGSPFNGTDWEQFRDPRETTYVKYTGLQTAAETFVDGLLRSADETAYDAELAPDWLATLERVLPVLRYPAHGLQMAAAYLAQMAPASRITIAALFQTGDEIRRIQRFAYRMCQLQKSRAGFGNASRELWEKDPSWQPLRRVIEHLLVAWDWGEAFVALNFAVKPAFDELFMNSFAKLARAHGDDLLEKLLFSLNDDCLWQRQWSQALLQLACVSHPDNAGIAEKWFETWLPPALEAVAAFALLFEAGGIANVGVEVERSCRAHFRAGCSFRSA